nr:MAG TPA: hypothetical protein [Caudoviricetes sp.]
MHMYYFPFIYFLINYNLILLYYHFFLCVHL